ncbi:MAG TPA: hypothetical protein VLG92_05055 [Candidatus Saccharimonadia bacterium]|nr:hypothetical protein [Candidatus Saccharimonadia bacterium]
MTTLNHAATGAVIAICVKSPWLAVPISLVSHYVCDVIPHFGIYEHDHAKRDANWLFRLITGLSVAGTIGLFLLIPHHQYPGVSWLTIFVCMLAATLPDVVWVSLYIREAKSSRSLPLTKFDQLHQDIQWYEKPFGLSLEIAWLGLAGAILWFAAL